MKEEKKGGVKFRRLRYVPSVVNGAFINRLGEGYNFSSERVPLSFSISIPFFFSWSNGGTNEGRKEGRKEGRIARRKVHTCGYGLRARGWPRREIKSEREREEASRFY